MLQTRASQEGWTAAQLTQAIQLYAGRKQGYGGRKVKGPASAELLLQQLVVETERWNHRYEQVWAPGGQLALSDLADCQGKGHGAHLDALVKRGHEALGAMRRAAAQAAKELKQLERRL